MLKALNNKRGSAIVWALLVLAMLSVLIATALTISFNYAQRSRSGVDAQQCYFSARSVAEAMAEDIKSALTPSLLPEPDPGNNIAEYTAELPDAMGICAVTVVRKGQNAASVTATVKRGLSSYSYTVDLAADSVVVPQFEGGLYVNTIGDNSPIQSVNRDLYIAGGTLEEPQTCVIDFPVSGNIFAPYSKVTLKGNGGVAGTIIANSITYEGIVSKGRFIPTAAISCGAGSQSASLNNTITEQRLLSSSEYRELINTGSAFKVVNPAPESMPSQDELDKYTPMRSNWEVEWTSDKDGTFKVPKNDSSSNDYYITLPPNTSSVKIVTLNDCLFKTFVRTNDKCSGEFIVGDGISLTLQNPRLFVLTSDYENLVIKAYDNSIVRFERPNTYSYKTFRLTKTSYFGQLTGSSDSAVIEVDDARNLPVEVLSLGWKITGSEEGAA